MPRQNDIVMTLIGDIDEKNDKYDGDAADVLKGFSMPDVNAYLRGKAPANLQDLAKLVDGYISLIPGDIRKCLDDVSLEDVAGNKCYNEINLYEARAFLPLINSFFVESPEKAPYEVVPYDLNDEWAIPVNRDDAETLAGMLAPCAYFVLTDGVANELGCY
jgi:hypothetical protein